MFVCISYIFHIIMLCCVVGLIIFIVVLDSCGYNQKLNSYAKVLSTCVYVGSCASVHRDCLVTTVANYFQLEWVCRQISRVVPTQYLLRD